MDRELMETAAVLTAANTTTVAYLELLLRRVQNDQEGVYPQESEKTLIAAIRLVQDHA